MDWKFFGRWYDTANPKTEEHYISIAVGTPDTIKPKVVAAIMASPNRKVVAATGRRIRIENRSMAFYFILSLIFTLGHCI